MLYASARRAAKGAAAPSTGADAVLELARDGPELDRRSDCNASITDGP